MDYLHIMSTKWETAQHCHSALSVLSTNIRHVMDTPSIEPSNHTDSKNQNNNRNEATDTATATRSKRRRLSFPYPTNEEPHPLDHQSHYPAAPSTQTQPLSAFTPDTQNTASASTSAAGAGANAARTTAYLYFPETQQVPLPSQPASPRFPGAGNFDLNMGDLLTGDAAAAAGLESAGAGLDSFLDLFGGQFPGF